MAEEVGNGQRQGIKRALIISISQYDKLESLEFCEKDGNKIYDVLTELGYEIPLKFRLIGGRIEYWKLRQAIMDFFYDRNVNTNDTLLFYFSGHGILGDDDEHYLSTSEIDPDVPQKYGFSFDDLRKARSICNSKIIFTILDCCYAGADRPGGKGEDDSAKTAKNVINEKSNNLGEGNCILSACKPMQKAYEFKEHGHSFFTFYLAEGLTNPECVDSEGDITPYKLSIYIDNRIRSLPVDKRPKQTPLLKCDTAGKIILAHHPKRNKIEKKIENQSLLLLKLLIEGKIEEFNRKRKETDNFGPLRFHNIDLSNKILNGADLHDIDFTAAKLVNVKLRMANFTGSNLKGAELNGSDLRGADLYRSDLSDANLTGSDLRGADLKGMIDFTGANLTGSDLRGADLKGIINFEGAILDEVDFSGAKIDMRLVSFKGAKIYTAKGLPFNDIYSIYDNEYIKDLKIFSEIFEKQVKSNHKHANPEHIKHIEENMKELLYELDGINYGEKIILDVLKKESIKSKIMAIVEGILQIFPPETDYDSLVTMFTSLNSYSKLLLEDVQKIILGKIYDVKIENAKKYYNVGIDFEKQQKYQEALKYYDKSLELNPNNKYTWNNRGISLGQLQKYVEAIESFSKALALDPNYQIAEDNRSKYIRYKRRTGPTSRVLGIYLGTSSYVAAALIGREPTIIPNTELTIGDKSFPSVVAFSKEVQLIVGEPARRQMLYNSEGTVIAVRRKMGTDYKYRVYGKEYTPQQISSFILQKIKRDAEAFLGDTISKAVIAVPAYFNDNQRQATKDAGKIAGLEEVRIINEPTAASLAFGLDKVQKDLKIMVFDLEDETLDVTILKIRDSIFEVKSTHGDTQLGGTDMDNTLVDYLLNEFKKQSGLDVRNDKAAMMRIREAAEKAKLELSNIVTTEINLPFLAYDASSGLVSFELILTRSKLEELLRPIVERCRNPMLQALLDAKLNTSDIDKIILVGGPTRMPIVKEFVTSVMNKVPEDGVDPMEAVALGAAIQGAIISGYFNRYYAVDSD